jgi:hypothetical protein
VTLGFGIGDVGAWLFLLWLCIDGFFKLDLLTEVFMKAALKTGMDALAVLWGLDGGAATPSTRRCAELKRPSRKTAERFDSVPPHQFQI